MARGLHADTVTELAKDSQYIFYMIDVLATSGTIRYTNAHHDVTFGGNVYTASPNFVSFGNIAETQKLVIGSMSFKLSGVDLSNLALALSGEIINKRVNLYQGFIDRDTFVVVPTPLIVYSGLVKSYSLSENPGATSVLTLATASILADFDRTAGRRSNHVDQVAYLELKGLGGIDKGFEFSHINLAAIRWGRV
jgi:hypothetical protein